MALRKQELVDAIKEKSVLAISEFSKMFEEEFGVSAAAFSAAPAAGAAAGSSSASTIRGASRMRF